MQFEAQFDRTDYAEVGETANGVPYRVLEVPPGTYTTDCQVGNPDPNSWLVLMPPAGHEYEVQLDGSLGGFVLDPTAERILLGPFDWVKGSAYFKGADCIDWYGDHSFSPDEWLAQASDPNDPAHTGVYRAPRCIYIDEPTSVRNKFLGVNSHDSGTHFCSRKATETLLQGVMTWDNTAAMNSVYHADAIGLVGWPQHGFTVRDSYIKGRVMAEDSPDAPYDKGGRLDLLFEDSWFTKSLSTGFIFNSVKLADPRGIFGQRNRVRSWGHNNGHDRQETVDGGSPTYGQIRPGRIEVYDTDIDLTAPSDDTCSPAAVWRASDANKSTEWRSFIY